MGYIPSLADPRSVGEAGTARGAWLWRLFDACLDEPGDDAPKDDSAPARVPQATLEEQGLARVLEPLIRQACTYWRRRGDDSLTGADVTVARALVAAAAGSDPVAASVCGFLEDVLTLVGCLRSADGQAAPRSWGDSPFDWTSDIPDGAPVIDLERAARRSDASWALYACASLHGLDRWRREAAAECVLLSGHALTAAIRQGRWDVTLVHRGRHEAALAAIAQHGAERAELFMMHNPNPIPDEIGWELARAHSRQQELLAAVPLSAAGLAFDIAIQLRASYEEEARAFFAGYDAGASPDLVAAFEGQGPIDPAAHPGPSADFEIALPDSFERAKTELDLTLCIAALGREESVRHALRERAERLGTAEPAPAAAGLAAALACEAADVADTAADQARASFLRVLLALVAQRRWPDVAQAVDAGLPYLDAFLGPHEAGAVDGYRLLTLSRQAPPEDVHWLTMAGCRALATSTQDVHLSLAAQVLTSVLANPAAGGHLDELIGLLIGLHLRRATLSWSLEPVTELGALLEAARANGAGDPALVGTALSGCSALLDAGATPEEMTEVIVSASAHPQLADLVKLLEWSAPSPVPEAAVAHGYLDAGVSAATHQALLDEDWSAVVRGARADLARLPAGDGTAAARVLLAGTLARGLRGIGDTTRDPAVVSAAAQEARALIDAAGEQVLRFADLAAGQDDRALWQLSAGSLGLAGIALQRRSRGGAVPGLALRLLERAAEGAAQDSDRLMLAGCLHDLGHAHLALAGELPDPVAALASLERAAGLLREALVLHRELRRRPGSAVAMRGRPEQVDLMNLGQAYFQIARSLLGGTELPDAGPAGAGPHVGPLYLRAALWTLHAGRDLARESGDMPIVAAVDLQLAQVKTELAMACLEHTRANKGAFRRDFQLFLAVIEQVPASTWEFASRYALSGLQDVLEALMWSAASGDHDGMVAALDDAFRILGLAQVRHGVSGSRRLGDDNLWNMAGMRRATLVMLQQAFDAIAGALADMGLDDVRSEVAGWSSFLLAQMRLEYARQQASAEEEEVAAAATEFERLRRGDDPILRAFARPYADWFSISVAGDRVAVNGIAVEPSPGGLEVILPAQGRSFVIEGLSEPTMTVLLREASWVKGTSTGAIASRLPQFDWSGAPAVVPVLAGTCRDGDARLLIARLPAKGWDAWVMHLAVAPAAELDLTLPFALRGIFSAADAGAGKRDDGTLGADDVAIMDAPGLAVEVSAAYAEDEPVAKVRRSGTGTRLRVRGEVRIGLRTAPAVTDADTSLLVRSDSAFTAACGAASSSVVSPALGIPGELMRAHAQLLPYQDTVDARLLQHVRDSSHRQVIVVGTPSTDPATDELLGAVADPGRDIVWIVEDRELPRVGGAAARLEADIARRCAAPVYAIAGSTDAPFAESPQLQVIVAPRHLAPAAVQLIVDLIAFRRLPVEDIPTSPRGFEFELLGDPAGMRRALTQLPNPATLHEVAARHHQLCGDLGIQHFSAGSASTDREGQFSYSPPGPEDLGPTAALWRPLSPRPALVVPAEPGLVLACTPYARHLGALLLPDDPRAWELISMLQAPRVLAISGCQSTPDDADVEWLPGDPRGIAMHFAARARTNHEANVHAMRRSEHLGDVDELLLRRMEPAAYAVVASLAAAEKDAATLAANYAATLGSPLLLFDDERVFSADARARAADVLSGAARGLPGVARDARPGIAPATMLGDVMQDAVALAELEAALAALSPAYLAFVSNRMTLPVELMGEPPLATRFAVGRLTAPDVPTLAMLISAAALREEAVRYVRAAAVIVEAAGAIADRYLPEAVIEARTVSALLARTADVTITEITGACDRDQFVTAAPGAAIIHFCGHGRYSDAAPDDTALVFRQGLLRQADIPSFERVAPIVFGNACESGASRTGEGLSRAWSGLAAGFIDAGALNYLGSLWPILDEGSRKLAERFYAHLVEGYSVGESLRIAKLHAFNEQDATWAAVVLFGCPRNRLRSSDAELP